jgi:hypothetical protein
MADELLSAISAAADGAGLASVPVKAIRAWVRRDEARNLMRELQGELENRWPDQATRGDVYQQIARLMQDSRLWVPFQAVVAGDARALAEIRTFLTEHIGAESAAGAEEVAVAVTDALAAHVGRAQRTPEAAVDVAVTLRHGQTALRLDAIDEGIEEIKQIVATERVFEDIRNNQPPDAGEASLAQALVLGPLHSIGAVDEVREAERAADGGDPGAGAAKLIEVANRLSDSGVDIASEALRERAAALLDEAGQTESATEVFVDLLWRRVARNSLPTTSSIRRLSEILRRDEQWIADAFEAIATWPRVGPAAVARLQDAATRSRGRADHLNFVAAATDIGSIFDQYDIVVEVANEVAPQPLSSGARLAVELDSLDARTALGEQTEDEWLRTLRWVDAEGTREDAARAWQRRGAVLAERGDIPASTDAYRRAMTAWAEVSGHEDQIADAFYSMQAAAIVNASPIPDPELRALAYELRGRATTDAARAEALIAEGMRQRLRPHGGHEALEALWRALAIGRRVGSLQLALVACERLGELYEHAGELSAAAVLYIAAGKAKEAVRVVQGLTTEQLSGVVEVDIARWRKDAVYAVVGSVGRSLTPDKVAEIAPTILADARKEPDAWLAPQPAISSKRALASIALAVQPDLRDQVFAELLRSLDHADYEVVRASSRALIMATNLGVVDATADVVRLFLRDPYNYGVRVDWVAERLTVSEALVAEVRQAALEGNQPALAALVLSDRVADDAEFAAACESATSGWIDYAPTTTTVEDGRTEISTGMGAPTADAGILARSASRETRTRFLDRMLSIALGDTDPEMTRAAATDAIYNLAPAVELEEARAAITQLLPLALGAYPLTQWDANLDHPLSPFLIQLHSPGALRRAALHTVIRLTESHPDLGYADLEPAITAALNSADSELIAIALAGSGAFPEMKLAVPLEAAMGNPSAEIRQAALEAFVARTGHMPTDEIVDALSRDAVAAVRFGLLTVSTDAPDGQAGIQRLMDDPDAYIRLRASAALESLPPVGSDGPQPTAT